MAGTRQRMVVSTALLMREKGARATSIDDVLRHSGAPRGSIYHHFPGGRRQLLEEATVWAGDYMAGRLAEGASAAEVLDTLIGEYRALLVESDCRAGCPIAAVAVEADTELNEQASAAFTRWEDVLAERLVRDRAKRQRDRGIGGIARGSIE